MAGELSVFVVVLLVMCAEFPRSSGSRWLEPKATTAEPAPIALKHVVYYPGNASVTMKWGWRLDGVEAFSSLTIKRYKENDASTDTSVASKGYTDKGLTETIDENYYSMSVITGPPEGSVTFTIKNVTRQTKNTNGGAVDVLARDVTYIYKCQLNIGSGNPLQRNSDTRLVVDQPPKITSKPESQYINEANKKVTLRCTADTGKPKPVISWSISRYGGLQDSLNGNETYTIDRFTKNNVGVYKCTARNVYGEDTVEACLQYTVCGSGCTTNDNLAIEITNLTWSDDYTNEFSPKYKETKKNLELACLKEYTKNSEPSVSSCIVLGYRNENGNVVAKMRITYDSGTKNPEKPLEDAIKNGLFDGYQVKTSLVSPTSDGQTPTPTPTPTGDTPTGGPDAGQRGTSDKGLSTGAIIAIVVVFSIIFIIIIVVLVVCMVKRKKPAGSGKPYKADDTYKTEVPLKSHPNDSYDNANDKPKEVVYADLNFQDRYPNGGGPPPKYTPSSNYAEVQPSHEQDESQVEWDKSVKDEMWI